MSIGNQARPRIFDLHIKKPSTLYGDVVEVDERVTLVGYTSDPEHASHSVKWGEDGSVAAAYGGVGAQNGLGQGSVVQGLSGEAVQILKELDEEQVRSDLLKVYESGYRSVAVVLAHSYVTFLAYRGVHLGSLADGVIASHSQITSSQWDVSPRKSDSSISHSHHSYYQ